MSEIKNIVELPDKIKNAIINRNLILFLGAGFSTICGLPTWIEFSNKLLGKVICDGVMDDFSKLEIISKSNLDAKQRITILNEIYKSNNKTNLFFENFKRYLKFDNSKANKHKDILFRFVKEVKSFVLTTNADDILDSIYNKDLIYYKNDINWLDFGPGKLGLIKIHGSIEDNDSLVFTTYAYLNRYNDSRFREYIKKTFNSGAVILFIGYGLNEFQLLESIFEVGKEKKGEMFILEGFFDFEEPLANAKKMYYETLNIKLLAYSRNNKDYGQLVDTLESWLNSLNMTGSIKADTYSKTIEIINSPLTEEAKHQFNQLIKDESFNMVSSIMEQLIYSKYGDDWLVSFLDKFDRSNNKIIKEAWLNTVITKYRSINFSNEDLDKNIILFLMKVQDKILENQKIDDDMFFGKIIELILTSSVFIESVKIDKFLDYYYENFPGLISNFWFSIKHTMDKGIIIDEKSKQAIFKSCIINSVKHYNEKKRNYYFNIILTTLTKAWISDIGEYIYLNTLEAIESVMQIDKYITYTIGSLYLYPDDVVRSKDEFFSTLISCLKLSTKYLKPQKIESEFLKYINDENKILSRLAMYFATINYSLLRNYILKLDNPLNRWHLYSDTLFMFKENINIMNDMEFNVYENWVNNAIFKNTQSPEYKKANKLSALSILNQYIIRKNATKINPSTQEELIYKEELISKEDKYLENKSNDKYRVFSDRNKDIMVSFESYTPEIKSELIDIHDFSKFVEAINKSNLTSLFDGEEIRKTIEIYIEKNSKYISNNLDEVFEFSNLYVDKAIEKILNSSNPNFTNIKFNLIEKTVDFLKRNEHLDLTRSIVWWLEKIENIEKLDLTNVYKLCVDLVDITIEIKWPENFEYKEFPYTTLINNMLYVAIQLNIKLYSRLESSNINVTGYLEKWLNNQYNKPIVKAALAYYISYIKTISLEFYKSNKESIFDNDIEGVNISLISYIANLSGNNWELNSNIEMIDKFISLKTEDKNEIHSFKNILIETIIINKKIVNNQEIFNIAVNKVDNSILIDIINNFINTIKNYPKEQSYINSDLKVIINMMNKSDEGSDILINRLLEFISISENDVSYTFGFMLELAKDADLYFDEEVMKNFKILISKYDRFAFDLLKKLTYDKPNIVFPFDYEKTTELLKELYKKNYLRESVIGLTNDLGNYNHKYYMFAKELSSS